MIPSASGLGVLRRPSAASSLLGGVSTGSQTDELKPGGSPSQQGHALSVRVEGGCQAGEQGSLAGDPPRDPQGTRGDAGPHSRAARGTPFPREPEPEPRPTLSMTQVQRRETARMSR